MLVTIHFKDRPPFTKEIDFPDESVMLTEGEPPPNGSGLIVGMNFEGKAQTIHSPIQKTADMVLGIKCDSFPLMSEKVRKEKFMIEHFKEDDLPLLIGSITTLSAQKLLEEKIRSRTINVGGDDEGRKDSPKD